MNEAFEKFGTMQTNDWRMKCRDLELVVGISATNWFQSFPFVLMEILVS